MPVADPEIRELLERLPLPETRPGFFTELDERMRRQDRANARRWRLAAVALAILAVPSLAAAATLAATLGGSSVVDRTVSCPVGSSFEVTANPSIPGRPIPADVAVRGGFTTNVVEIWTDPKGFTLDAKTCGRTRAKVPLTPSRLPADVVLHTGDYTQFGPRCTLSGRMLMRVRVHRSGSGTPTSAELAIWRATPKPKPLVFVRWSPSLIRTYVSHTACGG